MTILVIPWVDPTPNVIIIRTKTQSLSSDLPQNTSHGSKNKRTLAVLHECPYNHFDQKNKPSSPQGGDELVENLIQGTLGCRPHPFLWFCSFENAFHQALMGMTQILVSIFIYKCVRNFFIIQSHLSYGWIIIPMRAWFHKEMLVSVLF